MSSSGFLILRSYYHLLFLFLSVPVPTGYAQSISTSTPIPPLQWINLTGLLQGPSAPPLKDASIGYDNTTRTLIIFGGESQGGLPQQQTYLLNLDTLVWSSPSPQGGTSILPPPRSAAIGGGDFAASYRNGHVVFGGKGSDGRPLSDVWEFDYNNQFWSHVNTSSSPVTPALFGAVGGIDTNIPFNASGSLGPTNSFFIMGGVQIVGSQLDPVPLSEIWQLDISGVLSSNLVNSLVGIWSKKSAGNNTALSGQGGTVVKKQLVAFGGCIATPNPNPSCAQPYSYVTDASTGLSVSPAICAVPRIGAAVVANKNMFSSSFNSQVFVLLGLFNSSLWNDGGGLQKGEVGVLDINGGSWARILPAGDPGKTGKVSFPQPRSGAASISFPSGLVGSSRALYSDTMIFGGQDGSGNYLSDMWILRAYGASVSQSGQQWTGFGNGQLQTGVDANGAGVSVQYMATCANAINTSPQAPSSSVHGSPTTTPSSMSTSTPSTNVSHQFDTSVTHKSLAPVSLALLLMTVILYRLSLPSTLGPSSQPPIGLRYTSVLIFIVAYGAGLAGLVSSFTSISSSRSEDFPRSATSSNTVLRTPHGQAGLALFIALYGIIPLLHLAYFARWRLFASTPKEIVGKIRAERSRADSSDTAEKLNSFRSTADTSQHGGVRTLASAPSPGYTPPRRHLALWFRSREGRTSSESAPESESPVPRTFEVINRPTRMRHHSGSGTLNFYESTHRLPPPRNLSDLSWLERRRSVNAVGDLDYALMQLNNRGHASTPATTTHLSAHALSDPPSGKVEQPLIPPKREVILHTLMHLLILALCILSLVELWNRAPLGLFVAFLAWVVAFYAILVTLSWNGRPQNSTLTVLLGRIQGNGQFVAAPIATPSPSRPISMAGTDQFPFPPEPAVLISTSHYSIQHRRMIFTLPHMPIESDEDEDTRQRRIEDEMARRDVSIVTVPKRKLWVANPS
ncbi:hypothetical protein B0F90DRAFT_1622168 [Multifurca ochricompacta]|uniref:Galactose oxidase n=1 Tax=Multifurca ochricompacta TaxID=376703 RepID=A0AAD4QSS6_9AGAM|nr:hypothetical protein B0F90DRAFT_1622168 [Multifurca ochricompacta]